MVSEDIIGVETLTPLVAVGAAFLIIGVLGILATKYFQVLVAYWLTLFFGTVFTAWLLAYCFFNKTMIEDVAVLEFEESWAAILNQNVLPADVQANLPQACGGSNFTDAAVSADLETASFTCSTEVDFVEGMAYTQKTVEELVDSDPLVHIETCMNTCDDMDGCTGFFYQEHVQDHNICGYFHSEFPLRAAVSHGHPNGAVCRGLPASDEGASGEESSALSPSPTPDFVLGTSAEFRTECWGAIKDAMMSNMDSVAICLDIAELLLALSIHWSIKLLTLNTAIQAVRTTIDICMSVVGAVLVLIGAAGIATLGHESATMYLSGSVLLLGVVMLCLGVLFGCFSKDHPKCARCAVYIYGVLFVIVAGLAIGCISFEQNVREKVEGPDGAQWLDNFCDKACFGEIQDHMLKSRAPLRTCQPPSGDGPCEADYVWADDLHRESDPACNTTAIIQTCECPCQEATEKSNAAANAMEATKQFLITEISAGLATLGWGCILVAIYILIEALCHLYNSIDDEDEDSEKQDLLSDSAETSESPVPVP